MPSQICSLQLKTAWKRELSYKTGVFLLLVIIYVPPEIIDINAVVLIVIIC